MSERYATGAARTGEAKPDNGRMRVDWKVLIAFALQLLVGAIAYGRLEQKVDDLRDEMRDVKQHLVLLRECK